MVTTDQEFGVESTLRIDSAISLRPTDDGTLRIKADNIWIKGPVTVDVQDRSLSTIEFIARKSMLVEDTARFEAINGQALFVFSAGEKLYTDQFVDFDEESICHCLYSDGGDEMTDIGINVTPACSIPGAVCRRPN